MSRNVYTSLDHALPPPLLPFHDVVNVTSADNSAPTQAALARTSANSSSPSKDNGEWSENTREGEILANLVDFKDPREEEERALFNSAEGADDGSDEEVDSDRAESDSSTAMDHGYRTLGVYTDLDDAASGAEGLATADAESSADSESDVDMSEDQERVKDDDEEFYVAGKSTLDDASSVSSDSDDDSSSDSHIGVVPMDHSIAYTPSTAGPSTFPLLRRSKRVAAATPKRKRDEDPEDAFSGTPQAKRVKLTAPPAPRRTARARSTPEPASRATRIPSKGKKRQEPSRPLKMAASRATRIPRWFLEKYCIVNGEATCGAAHCKVVLCANKPAVARKHVRTHHHVKGELGAAGAPEVICLWGDCENMIRRGKNGGELMRHYDEVHLGVRYVCPGKCLDRQKKRRSFRRTDQITRHEKDNPCEYLRENPIPRGEKNPDAKPRTRTKSLKQ